MLIKLAKIFMIHEKKLLKYVIHKNHLEISEEIAFLEA